MNAILQFLIDHIEVDIVALLLGLISGVIWWIRRKNSSSNKTTGENTTVIGAARNIAINGAYIDESHTHITLKAPSTTPPKSVDGEQHDSI